MQSEEIEVTSNQCIVNYYIKSGYMANDAHANMKRLGLSFSDAIVQLGVVKYYACNDYVSTDDEDSEIPRSCNKYKTDEYILFRKNGKGHASSDGGATKTPITWRPSEDNQLCIEVALKDKTGEFCIHSDPKYLDGRGNPHWGLSTAYIIVE